MGNEIKYGLTDEDEIVHEYFLFYEDYLRVVDCLSDDDRLEMYVAICEYGIYERETVFRKNYLNAIFFLIKKDIDERGWKEIE